MQKIAFMEERKEVRKNIIQLEWQHRVMSNKIEDLMEKKKSIKLLRLTEDQQDMTVTCILKYLSLKKKQKPLFYFIFGLKHK